MSFISTSMSILQGLLFLKPGSSIFNILCPLYALSLFCTGPNKYIKERAQVELVWRQSSPSWSLPTKTFSLSSALPFSISVFFVGGTFSKPYIITVSLHCVNLPLKPPQHSSPPSPPKTLETTCLFARGRLPWC